MSDFYLLISLCAAVIFGLICGNLLPKVSVIWREVVHINHIQPPFIGYDGKFARITKCDDCNLRGRPEEDFSIQRPCFRCGGNINGFGSAEWKRKDGISQWVKYEER